MHIDFADFCRWERVVLLGLLSMPAGWARDATAVRDEFQEAKAAHMAIVNDPYPHPRPDDEAWPAREWELAGEWAVLYLDRHPEATLAQLQNWMCALDPTSPRGQSGDNPEDRYTAEFYPLAFQLESHAFVIAPTLDVSAPGAALGQYGTFFVVSRSGGNYHVTWSVRETADPRLQSWTAARDANGLFVMSINPLPATAAGHPRFYVDGQESHVAGETQGAQLSVWEWDGATPRIEAIRDYAYLIPYPDSDEPPVKFDGALLHVHTKESYRSFYTYGSSPDAEGELTIRIDGNGAEDLGVRRLDPELDWIDELYYRISRREPASGLAAPEVIAALTKVIPASDAKDIVIGARPFLLEGWRLQGSRLSVATSFIDLELLFTFTRSNGKLFVIGVEDISSSDVGPSAVKALAYADWARLGSLS